MIRAILHAMQHLQTFDRQGFLYMMRCAVRIVYRISCCLPGNNEKGRHRSADLFVFAASPRGANLVRLAFDLTKSRTSMEDTYMIARSERTPNAKRYFEVYFPPVFLFK